VAFDKSEGHPRGFYCFKDGPPALPILPFDWPDKMADVPIKVSKMIIGGTRIVQA
jgi:hypothetical protein